MKIVVFGPDRRVGALDGDRVVDLNRAYARQQLAAQRAVSPAEAAERVPSDLRGLVAAGREALELAAAAVEHARERGDEDVVHEVGAVELHAPWAPRARIACAGGNYADHMAGAMTVLTGEPVTAEDALRAARADGPWGFFKVLDRVLAPEEELAYPRRATLLDYEAEVAVVIAKPARDVAAADAADFIWGVTLVNDWSIRNDMGKPRVLNFNLNKNFDGSASIGPCIVVGELDPEDVPVELRVNGELRQSFNTSDMIFSFGEYLEHLTRDFTLAPGDVLAGGTGTGTAFDSSPPGPGGEIPTDLYLERGDLVEISSPPIGVLRNRVA